MWIRIRNQHKEQLQGIGKGSVRSSFFQIGAWCAGSKCRGGGLGLGGGRV